MENIFSKAAWTEDGCEFQSLFVFHNYTKIKNKSPPYV